MKLLNLLKLIKPESLARARKRIRRDLKQANLALIYRNVLKDGRDGYEREKSIYG